MATLAIEAVSLAPDRVADSPYRPVTDFGLLSDAQAGLVLLGERDTTGLSVLDGSRRTAADLALSVGPTPPSGAVVAIRVVNQDGPVLIRSAGRGDPPDADRQVAGTGACGCRLALSRSLHATPPLPGERALLTTIGADDWLLLEFADPASFRLTEAGVA